MVLLTTLIFSLYSIFFLLKIINCQSIEIPFQNINILDMNASDSVSISADCNKQIEFLSFGIRNREQWALRMLDASSKIPLGILQGNLKDIGMYDECVAIKVEKNNDTIIGRHCMYSVFPSTPQSSMPVKPMLSICLPAMCDRNDLENLLFAAIDITKNYTNDTNLTVASVTCTDVESKSWEPAAIITVIILGLWITFLVICTICELLMNANGFGMKKMSSLDVLSKFSLYTNGKRILSTKFPSGHLPAVSGLRFFSMSWVIFGHTYTQTLSGGVINLADIIPWLSSWSALTVLIAPFAVDTFFVLSGFLTSYLFIKGLSNRRTFNPIIYYIHRYIRLTPALVALLLLTIYIVPRIGSGALWQESVEQQKKYCSKYWWSLLLYIQNYRGLDVLGCLGHTWYLAVDMQLFWISPIILYPLAKKPKVGIIIFTSFFIISIITPVVIVLHNKYSGGLFTIKNFSQIIAMMENYYIPTHTRAAPWLMGVFLGYKLNYTSSQAGNLKIIGWIIALCCFIFTFVSYRIFQNENYEFNLYWEGFYAAFSRCIWAFVICWIIYCSVLNIGGIIGGFLSLPVFLPISRISYSLYLVHYLIQNIRTNAERTVIYFSNYQLIYMYISDFVLCIFIGFIFSLLFESPFLVLEKLMRKKSEKS